MKLLLVLLGLCSTVFAQPYLAMTGSNKNAGLSAGYLTKSMVDISAGYTVPYKTNLLPFIYHVNVGYTAVVQGKEADYFSVTPSVGVAYTTVRDITNYDKSEIIKDHQDFRMKYRIEFGKDAHIGRFFVAANYCRYAYYEFGIRAFIK